MKISSMLIAKANDSLEGNSISLDASEVAERITFLSDLKAEMRAAGFDATFPEMMIASARTDIELQPDLSKQLKELRETANQKRYAYNRVRVALASNKLLLSMLRRGRVYDVANYFPYDGAYLARIVYLGEPAVNAYNHILKLSAKRSQDSKYIVTIIHAGKPININLHSTKNLDEKIRKSYGDSAYLLSVKKVVSPPLVRFKSIRIAISVGYAVQAAHRIYPDLESRTKIISKQHEMYASEIAKFGISGDTRIDLMEGHEDLKDDLYAKGLIVYKDDRLALLPEIVSSIIQRKSEYSSAVVREAERQFSYDVFHFFMTEPRRVRSSLPLYPGISTTVEPGIFNFLEYSGYQNALSLVQEKIKFEAFSKVGRALGPAIIHLSGEPIEKCAKEFGVDQDEIRSAAEQINFYKTAISNQARKFIDGLDSKNKK
ncbi:MAG: DUF530 family protein [Candidatus Micrarchaeia archaeon]